MNSTEIEITRLFSEESTFVPFDLSNNRATLGERAGEITWRASLECARDTHPPLLDSEERKEAFRDFVRSAGAWDDEEIASWGDQELNALFLQWIAGDVREAFGDAPMEQWDWVQYEKDAESGRISSRLFRSATGKLYFDISN